MFFNYCNVCKTQVVQKYVAKLFDKYNVTKLKEEFPMLICPDIFSISACMFLSVFQVLKTKLGAHTHIHMHLPKITIFHITKMTAIQNFLFTLSW